ncbi:MAG: CheR family methyltransferase [Cyanobacteriota bacterium]|nr:CheR family methyltransferase [Cyanobacteriota bacterium]
MTQVSIENLLREKIGLDVNSISSGAIKRAISERMKDCGIRDAQNYLQCLEQSEQEWKALIELVIVPETWFFRERESFNYLKHYIKSEWLTTPYQDVLRVLSIPCSTGEEPYSIAIALLEAGLSATKVRIDAVDISQKNLLTAKLGIYQDYSFRGNPLSFQKSYFQRTELGYQLCHKVKSMVNFMYGNLADLNFLVGATPYDVIFCRNLLIYFDKAIKKRTIGVLERLLKKDGLLFLGYAETGLLLNTSFQRVRCYKGFTYRKPKIEAGQRLKTIEKYNQPVTVTKKTVKSSLNSSGNLLETVKASINQGNLHQAARLCNQYIQQNPLNIQAYILLSEVYQGMGNQEQAIESLKKAIYLQPDCLEALTHLAFLHEHRGDVESANLLWQRIQRLHKNY